MSTKAAAVDLLINKGNFEPQAALALVQAFVMILTDSQLVTIPVLDARLTDIKADITRIDQKIDSTAQQLDQKIDGTAQRLDQKIDSSAQRLENLIITTNEVTIARLEKAIEATKAELVRWVFLAMVGSGAIQAAAAAIINALQHH